MTNKKTLTTMIAAGLALSGFAFDARKDRPTPPKSIFNETAEQRDARRAWWVHDRFGMFIHFGLYALPARHEWVQSTERISPASYESRYMKYFDPDLFDAREWARSAKAAGMKYMVLTTKHHEGFCMWDTKTTDYKITNTPFKRDLVREYVEACRAEGLKVGFYFSIKDWHHPDYLIDQTHPSRPSEGFTDETYEKVNAGKEWNRYRECMYEQVRELLGNYGKIDFVWFDYTVKSRYGKNWKHWEAVELLKMVRKLQPGIIFDDRLDLDETEDGYDFVTPEQCRVTKWPERNGKRMPWETCQTFSGSWGYYRDEATWKSPHQLIEMLINSVAYGGNLIMNVGPTARGEFDYRAKDRLDAFGKWMHGNSRAIYGCTMAPEEFKTPVDSLLTYNPETRRLYVHILNYPMGTLPVAFADKIAHAQFLHDASEIKVRGGSISLPMVKPNQEIPVVECFLK